MTDLTESQTQSIKKSYLNILGLFLSEERIESRYLRCLLKWGLQLRLHPEDLKEAKIDFSDLKFLHPEQKAERVESIYHLVYMIYFDSVVEDIELEVAFVYAEKLGFQKSLVSQLFKSIATGQADEINPGNVREQVMEFLKLYEE